MRLSIFTTMAEFCQKVLKYTGLDRLSNSQSKQKDAPKYSMEYIETKMGDDIDFIETVSTEQLEEFNVYIGAVVHEEETTRILAKSIPKQST